VQYENDEAALKAWQSRLATKDYMGVNNEIFKFLKDNPNSPHWYEIFFSYGRAKEGIEDWDGAVQTYQQIIARSTDRQMEFVALAFYRMAFCYEVLLENEKALAALTDAARLEAYLPLEITLAEIPARIASIHARLNQPTIADQYAQKAEKGINRLRAIKRNSDPEWMSRTLVKMGSLSLTQIDEESFRQNILTLSRNQRYLIQAIEINHSQWGPEAQQILLFTYNSLWTFIQNYQIKPTKDWEADMVNEAQKKADFVSWYLEALENLKSYQAPEESSAYLRTAEVYHRIKSIETDALALLQKELLKKPWNDPLKASLYQHSTEVPNNVLKSNPHLGRDTSSALDLESGEMPVYIPRQLPPKRPKKKMK
jgi:hypothetical protein